MGDSYRVTGEYVTLKVKDSSGASVVAGFYKGGIVSDVDPESLEHHLNKGMLEVVEEVEETPEAPKEPTVDEVLADVGEDKEKAQAALDAEQAKEKPRATLVGKLESILGKA